MDNDRIKWSWIKTRRKWHWTEKQQLSQCWDKRKQSVRIDGGLCLRLNLRVNCYFLFPYPRVLPMIGNSVPTLAFLSRSSEELLEDSSQLSLQVNISQLQVTSRTEVQRASADSTSVSLPSPYYFEGTSSSKKEFSCNIFHYHGSDLSKDGKWRWPRMTGNDSDCIESWRTCF